MGEAKHTPTPWSFVEYDSPSGPYFLLLSGSWDIAHNRHSSRDAGTERANAAFIIRAANSYGALLEACKVVIHCVVPCSEQIDERGCRVCTGWLHEVLPQVRAAIALAEGTTDA